MLLEIKTYEHDGKDYGSVIINTAHIVSIRKNEKQAGYHRLMMTNNNSFYIDNTTLSKLESIIK